MHNHWRTYAKFARLAEQPTIVAVVAIRPPAPSGLSTHEREPVRHKPDGHNVVATHALGVHMTMLGLRDADFKVSARHDADDETPRFGAEHGDVKVGREWHVRAHRAVVAEHVTVEGKRDGPRCAEPASTRSLGAQNSNAIPKL